jgi:hypothetical protein
MNRAPDEPRHIPHEHDPDKDYIAAPGDSELKHEKRDVAISSIIWFGVVLTVGAVASVVFLAGLFWFFIKTQYPEAPPRSPMAEATQLPPEPRLQINPPVEMDRLLVKETDRLSGYKWIDQKEGTVQIPIERAMEIVGTQGVRYWTAPPAVQQKKGTNAPR